MRIHNTAFTLVAGQVFSTGGGSGQGHPSAAAAVTMNGGGRAGGGEIKPSITPLNRQQITEVGSLFIIFILECGSVVGS